MCKVFLGDIAFGFSGLGDLEVVEGVDRFFGGAGFRAWETGRLLSKMSRNEWAFGTNSDFHLRSIPIFV